MKLEHKRLMMRSHVCDECLSIKLTQASLLVRVRRETGVASYASCREGWFDESKWDEWV